MSEGTAAVGGAVPAAQTVDADPLGRSGIDDRPLAFGFLLGYVDLALRGVQEYETYRNVELGPWFELERPRGSVGLRQWHRAVHERRRFTTPNALGELRVRMDFRDRSRPRRRRTPGETDEDPARFVDLRVGTPRVALFVTAPDDTRAERLMGLARDVAERFRRQLD
ncbi:MAG: hypothetical protein L3K18_00195 [Thermoplasmata archaeon]|nr:hypothetical protein [Thermoplasmata archaeon]MCI4355552.1 hypothetical protein [Thermoplasmata archaeon]